MADAAKPETGKGGVPPPSGWTFKAAFTLAQFGLCFMLGMTFLFVHVNATAALVTEIATRSLATLPLGALTLSAALVSYPMGWVIGRIGSKRTAPFAALVGAAGSAVCLGGAVARSVGLLVVGTLLQGVLLRYVFVLRFDASMTTPVSIRARATSFVICGAAVSGVLARELTLAGRALLQWPFAGCYVFLLAMSVLMGLVLAVTDYSHAPAPQGSADGPAPPPLPFGRLIAQPKFYVAAISTAATYTSMASLMAATPVRMAALGYPLADGATVIQFHVVAMYVPSLFSGDLVARLGPPSVIVCGYSLLLAGLLTYLAGPAYGVFVAAMVVIGVGWNLAFVGSTALLTGAFTGVDRLRASTAADAFAMFLLSVGVTTSAVLLSEVSFLALLWTHFGLSALGFAVVVAGVGGARPCSRSEAASPAVKSAA